MKGNYRVRICWLGLTTPWTLPANLVLAVNEKLTYGLYQVGEEKSRDASEDGERGFRRVNLNF